MALLVSTTINGDHVEFACEPDETLLDALRNRVGLTGVKEGCGTGDCGACSVLIDGRLVCSCLVLGAEAEGSEIETVEGMADGAHAAPVAAEVPGTRGAAMRRLHPGLPDRRQGAAGEEPRSDARRKSVSDSPATFAAAPAMTRSCAPCRTPPKR